MINFHERVLQYPDYSRQFTIGDSLITIFSCPLEARLMKARSADLWSQFNFILYVVEGSKIWHTAHGSHHLEKGSCVFIRKGASIVEQVKDSGFCTVLFFIPDEFICETLKMKSSVLNKASHTHDRIIPLDTTETLVTFFLSMSSFFADRKEPDPILLELKFRELILTVADNPHNGEMLSYFCSLLHEPRSVGLLRVMDDNYCFNLQLKQYAELSNRSLSAFKRDFQRQFGMAPGKWLLERRLRHAHHLLRNAGKAVNEAAFESGFENASHFSRAFKERFGIPPTAVRDLRNAERVGPNVEHETLNA